MNRVIRELKRDLAFSSAIASDKHHRRTHRRRTQ